MAMEVVCGNCQGRLLVEHMGVVVACPHCGAHLQIGEAPPPAAQVPQPVETPPAPQFAPPPPEPVAVPPASVSPFADFNPTAVTPPPVPAPAPPAVPQPIAPPPVATPETSPFPASFESPVVATSQPEPEPIFPEIILTPPAPVTPAPPPAPPATPTVAVTPEPVSPAPAWEPPQQMGLPPTSQASDSWMPQINLEMPRDIVTTPAAATVSTPTEPPPPPQAVPETATTLSPAMPVVDTSPSTVNLSPPPSAGPANQTAIWNPVRVEESRAEIPTTSFPGAEPAFANFGNFQPAPVAQASIPSASPAVLAAPAPSPATFVSPPTNAAPAGNTAPQIVVSNERREATVPRAYFVLVASYASAVTLAFLYIWWRGSVATLDLPDIRPKIDKNGQYGLSLIPESPLPPAFRLKLGESKRYGNLMVTPLKVTKGPLEFVHFGDEKQTKPATQAPVLKLWVKFENVSSDQTFPVLDEQLLFQRVRDKDNPTQDRSNNYVCLQSERKRMGKRIPVYTFPIKGDWLLKGQQLDTPVKPHEAWETYIPSNDEDLSELKGPLTWRVHFRKGYNPESYRGVTTLVEVEFDSKDIEADA